MLNVVFGRELAPEGYVLDSRVYFRMNKKPEWFEDDFVKRFIKAIDGSEVLFEEALKDKYGHGISTEMLSTGCKTLCDIYYSGEDMWFYGSSLGDNCYPFLLELSRTREVNIFLEHYPYIDSEYFEEGLIRSNGVALGEYDFDDLYADWCRRTDEADD